jgi:hypothetical protein
MMRSTDDDSSRGAPGISMRTWLYLGAAVLGLSLMGLEDRTAEDRMEGDIATAPSEAGSAVRSASVPVASGAEAMTSVQHRSVKLDLNGRISLR